MEDFINVLPASILLVFVPFVGLGLLLILIDELTMEG